MTTENPLADLSRFPPDLLVEPDTNTQDQWHHHREFADALRTWLESKSEFEGLEAAIAELNKFGHQFKKVPRRDEVWVIYREPLPDDKLEFQISASWADGPEIMLTTPMTDEAWERQLEERRTQLSDDEKEVYDLQQEFYEKGGTLFLERWDEWTSLSPEDQVVMALYVLDTEINNGGFAQYFSNTEGIQAEFAREHLVAIGANTAATLLTKAISIVGGTFADELSEEQWDALEANASALDKLDDSYYSLDDDVALLTMQWLAAQGLG